MRTGRRATLRSGGWLVPVLILGLVGPGCRPEEPAAPAGPVDAAPETPAPPSETAWAEAEAIRRLGLAQPVQGDLDSIREQRLVRAVVPYNATSYFLDGATPRGVSYELLKLFEKFLNEKLGTSKLPVFVLVMPVTRDQLLARVEQGFAHLAVGNLTVTEARRQRVAFSEPVLQGVRELVVTGPAGPAQISSLEALSGQEVWVRRTSTYFESLERTNEVLREQGHPPVRIREAPEVLEDEDLLEMLNAGLLGISVVDEPIARLWAQLLPEIRIQPLALREAGEFAWAVGRDMPRFRELVDEFVRAHRKGTLTGNVLFKRYLQDTRWARAALSDDSLTRFHSMVGLFQRYADRYDFDWLLVAAQGYQESQLDQSRRSHVGAIGVMQMMPETARDPSVGIPDIEELEPNIHAGTRYLRVLVDRYFDDPGIEPLDRMLFAFAAYNAGPTRISRLRRQAAQAGLDPDRWFRNVELVVAREVGREPVQYVSNIYKYYLAYRLVASGELKQRWQLD